MLLKWLPGCYCMVNDVNDLLIYLQERWWSQNSQLCGFTMWLGSEVCYSAILLNLPCGILQFNRWEPLSHVMNQKALTGHKLFEEKLHWEIIRLCISKHLSISWHCFAHRDFTENAFNFLKLFWFFCVTPSCDLNQGRYWLFRILFLYHQDANSKPPPPLALWQLVAS